MLLDPCCQGLLNKIQQELFIALTKQAADPRQQVRWARCPPDSRRDAGATVPFAAVHT
jgi:hypothetical protein